MVARIRCYRFRRDRRLAGIVGRRCHHLGSRRHGGSLALDLLESNVDGGALDLLVRSAGASLPVGAASGAIVRLHLGGARGTLLLVDQRLPVGDRDLIIIGVNFAEGEKAVTVAAVIDEGGLQRRLDARHLGKIDIAAKLLTIGGLEVEFLDAVATQNDHAGLFRMGRIDQHFVGHGLNS